MPELVVVAEQLLAPVPGGTGRYTEQLLRALVDTAPTGWTVSSVVARHPGGASALDAARIEGARGPQVLPLSPRTLATLWQIGVPWWPGDGAAPTAIHAPTPLAPPLGWRGLRGLPGVGRGTLSVTVHDTVPWTHPETLTRRGAHWHRTMIRRAARRADALVVPTEAVAADLRRHIPVSAEIRVAGHGVTEVFATDRSVGSVDSVDLELPDRFVLAVGTIEPRKGLDVLIKAMAEFEGPPLVVVGAQGWGGLDLTEIARRHGLPTQRLRLLGRLSDQDLAATMRRASVLAIPSLAEGFGLPLLEAMASGTPVVHTDVPALVEVAAGTTLTVPRNNPQALSQALQRLLNTPSLANSLTTAAKTRAQSFTWHHSAQTIWQIHHP